MDKTSKLQKKQILPDITKEHRDNSKWASKRNHFLMDKMSKLLRLSKGIIGHYPKEHRDS